MSRLVSFLGRKSASVAEKPANSAQPGNNDPENGEVDVDQDLFFPIATQLGQENEAIRNLLIDAECKLGELDNIKRSIGKLVEPVSKTLRDYEQAKNEKLSLQSALNTTRVAHNKLRDDLTTAERKAGTFETECARLREILPVAQQSVAALEKTKAEQTAELTARRTHIAEMQRQMQQQGGDLQLTHEENRRLSERFTAADKRMVQLEGESQAAQQKAMQSDNERAAVQAALDKALNDYAQTARRLTETDKNLAATQSRLKAVEAGLGEAHAERSRLSTALDDATHKHLEEISSQQSRFDALQARANLTENLLEETRQTLMARADEVRALERRVTESSAAHNTAGEKLGLVEAALAELDHHIKDLEQANAALYEQNQLLVNAAAAREAAYDRTQQKIREQENLVQMLEGQLRSAREANDMQLEQIDTQLQRERIERAMAEGALETGRKDVARLVREIAVLQNRPDPERAGNEAPAKPARYKSAA